MKLFVDAFHILIEFISLFICIFSYKLIYKMVWVWWIGRHDIGNLPLKLPAKPRPGPQTRRRQPVLNVETLIMLQLQGAFAYNVIGRLIQILRERKFKINQMLSYNIKQPSWATHIYICPASRLYISFYSHFFVIKCHKSRQLPWNCVVSSLIYVKHSIIISDHLLKHVRNYVDGGGHSSLWSQGSLFAAEGRHSC